MTVYEYIAHVLDRAGLTIRAVGPSLIVAAPLLAGCSGCCGFDLGTFTCGTSLPKAAPAPPVAPSTQVPTCDGVCARSRELGCPGAAASPGGVSCEDRCAETMKGIAPLDLACRAAASSCSAADLCELPR